MKNAKKKALIIAASCMFALMMMFNVNVSMDSSNTSACISLSGMKAMAASTQEDCRSCVRDLSQTCDLYSEWIIGMRNNNC